MSAPFQAISDGLYVS